MDELEQIMELLATAQRKAEAMGDSNLAYHIGTARLVAMERKLEQRPPRLR